MHTTTTLFDIDLQLFSDGAAAGAPSGDGGEGTQQTGASTLPKADTQRPGSSRRGRSGDYDNVVFGKAPDAEPAGSGTSSTPEGTNAQGKGTQSGVTTTSDTLEAKRQAFRDLIEGEYKDQYTEAFQSAFNSRFKMMKGMEQSLEAQKPIIDMLMQRHGIADGDISKLAKAIEQDDGYWEAAADEAGLTVEQYKAMQRLERENEELRKIRQRQQGQEMAQQKLNQWYAEAEQVKQTYPAFDFRAETQNRDFMGLLRSGLNVQQAYELVHMDEIKEAAARTAAETTGRQMTANLKAKASRPRENGTSTQSAAPIRKDKASELTRAERAEIVRRAARGDRIEF